MKIHCLNIGCAFLILLTIASCSSQPVKDVSPDFQLYFEEYGVKGCFLLYDMKENLYKVYNSQRCEEGFLPASTFKIIHALIGLETGVIVNENMVIRWDSIVRSVASWNKDQTLASAISNSAVPYFQEVARRIGPERMIKMVDKLNYGQMDINPKTIDYFWLEGNSRITSWEQMNFLIYFYRDELPVNYLNIETVKELIILKKNDKWVLSGKTGMVKEEGKNIGWFIGYLVENRKAWLFVCNVESGPDNLEKCMESRSGITQKVLQSMGLMKE